MRMYPEEKKALEKSFSNKSRKARVISNRLLVPQLMDEDGELLPEKRITERRYLWDWNLRQGRFLSAFKNSAWDFDKAVKETNENPEWAKRFVKSKNVISYQLEDQHRRQLAEIPTPEWIRAEYTAGAIGEVEHSDTQLHCLDRLKDIVIPRALASVSISQTNVFQMPSLDPTQEKAAREFFDTIATEKINAA